MSLLLLFNQPPYFKTLLDTARRLATEGEGAIAVVVAHMAFEVAAEQAFSQILQRRGITGELTESCLAMMPDRTFMAKQTRNLWTALTAGDLIKDADGWKTYDASVQLRNAAVHSGATIGAKQAASSIEAIERVIAHVQAVAFAQKDGATPQAPTSS